MTTPRCRAPPPSTTEAPFETTTTLALAPWTLPEGGLAVDLPVDAALAPTTPPDVPWPFVGGAAHSGTSSDGRTFLVAKMSVHDAYEWESNAQALMGAVDGLGQQQGFAVAKRSAGAVAERDASEFTVVDQRGPAESDADFQKRREGDATGSGVAVVSGNDLYVVLVRAPTVAQAGFGAIRDSIVLSQAPG